MKIGVTLLGFIILIKHVRGLRNSGPYGKKGLQSYDYDDYDDFSVDVDLLENHRLDDKTRRSSKLAMKARQGYADYDYKSIRRDSPSQGFGGGGGGHGGGYGGGGGGHGGGYGGGGGGGGGGYG